MSNEPLRIGVTMRVVQAAGYLEPRDALAQNWSNFLSAALPEMVWLPLPNLGKRNIRKFCVRWGINRLILTGGEDIGDAPIRDETEIELLNWAMTSGVPALGICRGMQLMAVSAGGTLKAIQNHVHAYHSLSGDFSHRVNSFHSLGLVHCPFGFKIAATAEDGEIEAISDPGRRWNGWMWHPERETPFNPVDIQNLRTLFA